MHRHILCKCSLVLSFLILSLVALFIHRACNSIFTALEHCQEAVEITSEDHIIQVNILHTFQRSKSFSLNHKASDCQYLCNICGSHPQVVNPKKLFMTLIPLHINCVSLSFCLGRGNCEINRNTTKHDIYRFYIH